MFDVRSPKAAVLGGMLTLLTAAPGLAQEEERYRDRGPILYGSAGGYSAFRDVTPQGLNFDNGYNFGGGLGYQFNPKVALRANLSFARSELQGPENNRTPGPGIDPLRLGGREFDKYFYGADLQFRYPTRVGLAPYLVLGGGAVTVNPNFDDLDSFTRPAGKVGAGLDYTFPRSGMSVFAEWNGWVYQWDEDTPLDPGSANPDKTQFDSTWSGGLRFVF